MKLIVTSWQRGHYIYCSKTQFRPAIPSSTKSHHWSRHPFYVLRIEYFFDFFFFFFFFFDCPTPHVDIVLFWNYQESAAGGQTHRVGGIACLQRVVAIQLKKGDI